MCKRTTAGFFLLPFLILSCWTLPSCTGQVQKAAAPAPVPAFVDWAVFDKRGFSVGVNMAFSLEQAPVFDVHDEALLEQQLQPHLALTPAENRFEMIHGIPCIVANSGHHPSNMGVKVDLEVENATAWEAMVEVLRQVNCNLVFGDSLRIFPMGKPRMYPPPAFWETPAVTVALQDVSAREALCAIMAQSPVEVGVIAKAALSRLWKDSSGATLVHLYFYEDGKEYMGPEDGSPPEGKDPEPFFDGIREIELSVEECEELGLVRQETEDDRAQ